MIKKLDIDGPLLIISKKFHDDRGYFQELYRVSKHDEHIPTIFRQDNISCSKSCAFRGLHWQTKEHAQAKLVSCLQGQIIDFIVDIRKNSKSFGKWISVTLKESDEYSIYVPEGFAHGFLTLENNTMVHYKCTKEYFPESAKCMKYFIDMIPNYILGAILSEQDQNAKTFEEYVKNNSEDLF
jgi:dTDP-4-dehydrorhamnose 3,5-epimerase